MITRYNSETDKEFPELRAVQDIELGILVEFDRICRKYNLCYFLDSGTALGAVRHNGFIPWDDDIDVAMPRPDYEKFLKIATSELDDELFLQTPESDPLIPFSYAKIRKNGTLFIEWNKRNIKMHHGIYIDIFPYDRLPNTGRDEYMELCRGLNKKLFKRGIPDRVGVPELSLKWRLGANLRRLQHYAYRIGSRKALFEKINKEYSKFSELGFDEGFSTCHSFSKKIAFPNEKLFPPAEADFEGNKFYVPADVSGYLTMIYGDYMRLPAIEERIGHRPMTVSIKEELCKQ